MQRELVATSHAVSTGINVRVKDRGEDTAQPVGPPECNVRCCGPLWGKGMERVPRCVMKARMLGSPAVGLSEGTLSVRAAGL